MSGHRAKGRLHGKVAIVTGAAPRKEGLGTGKATALLFAREGASVVLVNRRADAAERLVEEIRADGGEAAAFAGDVSEPATAEQLAEFAMSRYGRLDVLINNIGFAHYGKAEAVALDDWHDAFRVNLTTALLCSRYCIPKMRDGGGGAIVNYSSSAAGLGLISRHGGVAYVTTKAGMHGFTLSIAADYAVDGIRCNCVVVGPINTPMVAHLGPEALERRRHVVPLKTEGTAWDIAHAALYLASDEARWVTGVFLPVDGGFLSIREWPR